MVALGQRIRQMREEQGMTPAELACAAGIDREYLEALEAGELTPADDLLAVLAAGFVSNSAVREAEG
jgi:transcriptional regulator with XRE-family HTH domain